MISRHHSCFQLRGQANQVKVYSLWMHSVWYATMHSQNRLIPQKGCSQSHHVAWSWHNISACCSWGCWRSSEVEIHAAGSPLVQEGSYTTSCSDLEAHLLNKILLQILVPPRKAPQDQVVLGPQSESWSPRYSQRQAFLQLREHWFRTYCSRTHERWNMQYTHLGKATGITAFWHRVFSCSLL